MEVRISKKAFKNINQICAFICDDYHAEETALKFSAELQKAILELSINYKIYALCKNTEFAFEKLQCFVFKKKWIVAYKSNKSSIVVRHIVNGKLLK